jgi:hypothetical protein
VAIAAFLIIAAAITISKRKPIAMADDASDSDGDDTAETPALGSGKDGTASASGATEERARV